MVAESESWTEELWLLAREGDEMTMPTQEATTSVKLLSKKRNLRIRPSDTVKGLKAQVKRLERQREFLSLWKPDSGVGSDVDASYVDVELQACDGSPVYAHKAMLAAKSSEFHAAFRANADVKVIEVPEMTLEELKAFVSFFYTGTISPNIMTEFMTTFLRAADKYKMQYLAAVCEDALASNLSRENAITTFDIAKKQCSNAAKESVLKKLLKMGEISTYEEYKVYTQKDPGLLLELYEQLSERIGPLLAKRRRITTDLGPGEQELVNNTLILYDGGNDKSDSDDDDIEDDQKGDDNKELKQEGENEITLGGLVPTNGGSPYSGNGASNGQAVMFWHGGPPIPPQHGRPFAPGYDKTMYGPAHRPPAYDGQTVTAPPYGVPPFMPPMYPSGPVPRGNFVGAGTLGVPVPVERPVGGEELIVHEARGKKLTVESQAKIEGRRGQNWTNSEVESLIALRGEMHEEFERNKQKQGVNTWNKLHVRMLALCRGFRKSANACKKKYSILYNEYKKDRENQKEFSNDSLGTPGSIMTKSKKCAYFDQMDMWHLNRTRVKADAHPGDTTDSPCTSGEEDVEIKEE